MWFGAAFFLAGALASWHIRADGEQTGTLRFGGRHLQVISRDSSPESFATWSAFFLGSTALCAVLAIVCVVLAWHLKRKTWRHTAAGD